MWKKAGIVLAVLFGVGFLVLVANAFRIDREREALSLCYAGIVDSYCEETSLSDDGKCVRKILPDGAQCRDFKVDFCYLSCVCKDGHAQKEKYDCDDGNPCTVDQCEFVGEVEDEMSRKRWVGQHECVISSTLDGVRCGPNFDGECRQNLCVMHDGTIHLDHPRTFFGPPGS